MQCIKGTALFGREFRCHRATDRSDRQPAELQEIFSA